MQQVIDDIGVDLDSHVTGGSALEGRIAQVADGHGGSTHQHDLVFERAGRKGTVNYIRHGVLLVGPVRAGVVDESGTVARWQQLMLAQLDALQAGLGNVGGDFLVRNLFVLPHRLQRQRGKEILVLVTHDEERMAERAVGVRIDVNESVRRGRFRQLGNVGFGPRGDRAPVLDP